ncbi:right-handed parallel beta-helix repeat-containing protein [Halorussus halobius]|uniref:right-handed parallel beta-helix repeat-containing protein n=1 Tax=Halorussus halobius TaxID=1710537 RepID=UPI0010922251|nr:right-handed parallel beta-helix repeat-containing protein [Halorussus halobius]
MARDKTARERDQSRLSVDRRSFLGAAGAGVASALGVGALTGGASAAEYETVTVSSGQTENFSLGSGDTLENVLIDVTADGAGVSIRASGDDWTIRNVGVKGPNDSGPEKLFVPSVSAGGSALVENFYIGDGTSIMGGSRQGGVWVAANDHRGELTFRNVNIGHWADNGLYGSGPGLQLGDSGGVVKVENSIAKNNNIAGFRLSGDGSYVKNSTIVSTDDVPSASFGTNSRGIWAKDTGDVLVENCDIVMTGPDATHAVRASHGASATVRNCRVTGEYYGDVSTENVTGDPTTAAPEGCPTTAEEAASGSSSAGTGSSSGVESSDDADDEQTTTDPDEDAAGAVLELVSGSNASNAGYEFTVEGSVTRRTSADDVAAESGDEVAENGDGTVTVSGVAGNGYGDSFLVDGDVVSMDLDESQWTLRYDGAEVAVDDLVLPNKLVVDGSNHPRVACSYTFEVSGQARKSAALGSVNDYDTVSDGEISGRIIGGTDGYRFSGEITGFDLDGPARVRVEDGS